MSKHYTDWKSIDAPRAMRALEKGARLFPLQAPLYRGGTVYAHGLETQRGACYLISRHVRDRLPLA